MNTQVIDSQGVTTTPWPVSGEGGILCSKTLPHDPVRSNYDIHSDIRAAVKWLCLLPSTELHSRALQNRYKRTIRSYVR
jgi:hypothetical protein